MNTFAVIALAGMVGAGAPNLDRIDLDLQRVLEAEGEQAVVSTLVFLRDQGNLPDLVAVLDQAQADRAERNEAVVLTLQETAALTQRDLLQSLEDLREQERVASYESFWLANVVRVDAPPAVIRDLSAHPDVLRIYFNYELEGVQPVEVGEQREGGGGAALGAVEIGIEAVRAPEVWEMGFDGTGVLVASLDTGVDGNHPALAHRWRGLHWAYANPEWAWFDPVTFTTFPTAFGAHGTHTMGTVVGGSPGNLIGVAPGAQWMHAAVIDRVNIPTTVADAILSFQWMVAPTGNPANTWAVPHVCSNSWGLVTGHGYPPCDPLFWYFIDNSEAAGTIQLFSAGNEGTFGLRRPADRATDEYRSVAVAAIDANDPDWPLAGFSSQGPTECTLTGEEAIKPEISAPGLGVISAMPGGGYGPMSGTSMASPHINGVAALMVQACPGLTVDQIKQIMYDTATDLGTPGKNNQYGYGMVNAEKAVSVAMELCPFNIMVPPPGAPLTVSPVAPTEFLVTIYGQDSVAAGTERLYYRIFTQSWIDVPLTPLGGNQYLATLPPVPCGHVIQFFVRATSIFGSTRSAPMDAPFHYFSAKSVDTTLTLLHENFNVGLPDEWTATGLWHVTDLCEPAGDCGAERWAYFGETTHCTYKPSTKHHGHLSSHKIELPPIAANQTLTLSFCYALRLFDVDSAWFEIEQLGAFPLTPSTPWTTMEIDLSGLAGDTVVLTWYFKSSGLAPSRDYGGLWVDKVTVDLHTACLQALGGEETPSAMPNALDVHAVLDAWGECDGCTEDLNGDGVVDMADLLILLSATSAND